MASGGPLRHQQNDVGVLVSVVPKHLREAQVVANGQPGLGKAEVCSRKRLALLQVDVLLHKFKQMHLIVGSHYALCVYKDEGIKHLGFVPAQDRAPHKSRLLARELYHKANTFPRKVFREFLLVGQVIACVPQLRQEDNLPVKEACHKRLYALHVGFLVA